MLIGVCGGEQSGICAGKKSVVEYLVREHNFQRLAVVPLPATTLAVKPFERSIGERIGEEIAFQSVEALLEFVTTRWQKRWVINDLDNEIVLESLLRRPFFLLVSVDAPVSIRWQRCKARCVNTSQAVPTLEEFVLKSDEHLYNSGNGLAHLVDRAQVRLLNSSNSITDLHQALEALNLTDDQRLRPSWDQYFMQLASLAAQRSNCMRRRVGCVVVREKRVISTGYNGTPRSLRNCNEGGCPRCNGGQGAGTSLATCLCIHAEENALLEAGRERIREGSILYCDTCPCLTCSIKITQVGISEVVYSQSYYMDTETAAVFKEAGVHFRKFSPPRNGLVDLSNGWDISEPVPDSIANNTR